MGKISEKSRILAEIQGERLRECRDRCGYKQKFLAEQIYVRDSMISQIENGKSLLPKEHAKKLADLLGVEEEYLLGMDYVRSSDSKDNEPLCRSITLQNAIRYMNLSAEFAKNGSEIIAIFETPSGKVLTCPLSTFSEISEDIDSYINLMFEKLQRKARHATDQEKAILPEIHTDYFSISYERVHKFMENLMLLKEPSRQIGQEKSKKTEK